MNEITEATPEILEEKVSYTMKVLFGPLFGCELHLPADDYFIIINQAAAINESQSEAPQDAEHAAVYTNNTLFIPCDLPSANLVLRLSGTTVDELNQNGFEVEILDQKQCSATVVYENVIFTHEPIRFAIKRSEDPWSESIKHFMVPPAQDSELKAEETLSRFYTKKRIAIIISMSILFLLLLIAGIVWYKQIEKGQVVLNLEHALSGSPGEIHLYKGREDNKIYVLTTQYQALEWVNEALFKLNEKNHVVPIWLDKLQKNTVNQLNAAGYPVVQVDYSKPQQPVIVLWREISHLKHQQLKQLVLNQAPFVLNIHTFIKTKPQLLQDARQGLDRLHIAYRQINSSSGYALVIRDALSDNALSALNQFINQFNFRWGENVVNFTINLNENWLENKSYLDSTNGYLFLNPHHWYFPLNNKEQ